MQQAAPGTPATAGDHLPTARPRRYRSDTSDAEWAVLAPHVPAGTGRGRPVVYPRRDVVDAIRYLDRTGCQWDALPADFPHHKLVYHYFKDLDRRRHLEPDAQQPARTGPHPDRGP
ncbi:transposase [Plantactinospora sp. DSM 117369]